MLDFHIPTEDDKKWIDEILDGTEYFGCFCTFATLYLWKDAYRTQVARYGDALLIRGGDPEYSHYYMYPVGKSYDIREIITVLREDAANFNTKLVIKCAEKWQCDEIKSAFPNEFSYAESRNDFDYIYSSENLINLKGKKFHAKRNHISKFMRTYPDWKYEDIDASNVIECINTAGEWLERALPEADEDEKTELCLENSAIALALRNRENLGIIGGLIRVKGKVIAMTLGEPINKRVFVTHFEKADTDYDGAYAMINNQFAIHRLSSYEYINREEDMGIEGLRKAKLSYNPDILLEKYSVEDLSVK